MLLIVVLSLFVCKSVLATDISGYWSGYFSSNLVVSSYVYMQLDQFGKTVNGTVSGDDGFKGKIRGTVKGQNFKFKIQQTTKKCKGNFKGNATVHFKYLKTIGEKLQFEDAQFDLKSSTSYYMEFTFTGKNCKGTHKNGEGYVVKQ